MSEPAVQVVMRVEDMAPHVPVEGTELALCERCYQPVLFDPNVVSMMESINLRSHLVCVRCVEVDEVEDPTTRIILAMTKAALRRADGEG